MSEPSRVVSVEILGRRYPVRSSLDPGYVAELAAYVHDKMQTAADETPTGDTVKVAVLAALNIADELFRCQRGEQSRDTLLLERTAALERLVDEALGRIGSAERTRLESLPPSDRSA